MFSICLIVGKMCGEMLTVIFLIPCFLITASGRCNNQLKSTIPRYPGLMSGSRSRVACSGNLITGIRLNLHEIKLQAHMNFRQLRRVRIKIYVSYSQHTTCLHTHCTSCRFLSTPMKYVSEFLS
jgi:hypothetical protein